MQPDEAANCAFIIQLLLRFLSFLSLCFSLSRRHIPAKLLLDVGARRGPLRHSLRRAGRRLHHPAAGHRAAVHPHSVATPHLAGQEAQAGR